MGGVAKKIRNQVNAWRIEGHDVEVIVVCNRKSAAVLIDENAVAVCKPAGGRFTGANRAFANAGEIIEQSQPDLVYYRLSYPTPALIKIAEKHCFVAELNNDVLREVRRNYCASKFMKWAMCRYLEWGIRRLAKRSDGLVAVTHELLEKGAYYGFRCFGAVIPNSIDLDQIQVLPENPQAMKRGPRIAFLGAQENISGVQSIIELAKLTSGQLKFVTFGSNWPESLPDNIEVHGFLEAKDYVRILETCDVGLSTLCLYEKGLNEACSLKVREYLARGLPVVIAHEDTALEEENAPWHLRIPNEEGNVRYAADEIVEFAKRMRGLRVSREEIEEKIGRNSLEIKRSDFFKEVCGHE